MAESSTSFFRELQSWVWGKGSLQVRKEECALAPADSLNTHNLCGPEAQSHPHLQSLPRGLREGG